MPADGGSQYTRYLMAINWAIPTLTVGVVGNVYPVNEYESLFIFFNLFLGASINGFIVGKIVNLMGDDKKRNARARKYLLDELLVDADVSPALVAKVDSFVSSKISGSSIFEDESSLCSSLPQSLHDEINNCTKLAYLRRCPFFDFCSDFVLLELSSSLHVLWFGLGDEIVTAGDLGWDMFFLVKGSVEVVSPDGKTVFATLAEGAFFGEAALFFKSQRGATIRFYRHIHFLWLFVCTSDISDLLVSTRWTQGGRRLHLLRAQQGESRSVAREA